MADRPDPQQLRVSDQDRHQVAEVLREAAGEGRLELQELDERLEATYAAKVYADLVPILADLPTSRNTPAIPHVTTPAPRPAAQVPVEATRYDSSFAILGDQTRRGVWEIGPEHTAFALMGGVHLDLREAVFASAEVVINANAIMAGIDITVNPQTRVVVEGVGIMGAFSEARSKADPELGPDSPVVRVKGVALMAGVDVRRKPLPGAGRRSLHRGH